MTRIALIGMGQRGRATMERLHFVRDINIVATCDVDQDWHDVVRRSDIDLVWICTPWEWHSQMATFSMQNGKDVALEVPAVMTLVECRQITETSAETHRHCLILENCCYDTWHLGAKEIVRQGLLGRIKHLEGAYIHTVDEGWMRDHGRRHSGNPYPTHAFGPMCQLLPEGDAPEFLVSLSSQIPGDHANTSLIRSASGVSMMLHYDISTPRPYNRMQTICGTMGFLQKYPIPLVIIEKENVNLVGEEASAYVESFIPEKFRALMDEGQSLGVSNIMNYMMDCRIAEFMVEVFRARSECNPEPQFEMDTPQASLWSSVVEMTKLSVDKGSVPVSFVPQNLKTSKNDNR